uniref:ribosomal protein S17 n=1 Tax=Glaucosphaera vacuolata TaxID=38265 RepID=UPI001FCD4957|nr:ribosomal protein S17 [Glaucosphaera vacuolata]UNJ18729.1 ribosomal protein S17 [Glaucosphaera vacuolata]
MAIKEKIGKVVSDKMSKTIVVSIENNIQHDKYHKTIKKTTRYKAHDEDNQCSIGDIVKIQESRPLSKTKRWKVVENLTKLQK